MALPNENSYELQGITARGGYQIIDFENIVIPTKEGESVKINGIYDYINSIYPCFKPIFVYNYKVAIDGEVSAYPPVTNAEIIKEEDGSFTLAFTPNSVVINTNDTVHCFIV